MRKIWMLMLGILSLIVSLRAEVSDPQAVFAEANAAYEAGDYEQASELYQQLLPEQQSVALLYNLGNAEYHRGNYAEAIFHFEKARALAPANPDVRANLKLTRDAAQVSPPVLNWAERLGLAWPVNRWAWLAVVSFWATLALILLPRLWGKHGPLLKALTVSLAVVFIVCAVALSGYHRLGKLSIAVSEDVALKLSPTSSAPAKSYLKPGESAFILRRHGDFYFVETDGGKEGWVSSKTFEPVWN